MTNIIEIVRLLRENPELVNDRDKLQRTPLHIATKRSSLNMVTILLDFSADAKL